MRYKDWFWEPDLTSSVGYDVLSRRMKDGKILCSDVRDYFKQRSKIEKQYYSDLQKLGETSKFKSELGDLEQAWKEVKSETEKIAQAHERAAHDFDRLASEMSTFIDEQRRQVKQIYFGWIRKQISKLNQARDDVRNATANEEDVTLVESSRRAQTTQICRKAEGYQRSSFDLDPDLWSPQDHTSAHPSFSPRSIMSSLKKKILLVEEKHIRLLVMLTPSVHLEDQVQKAHSTLKSVFTKTKHQEKTFHKKCEEWDELSNQVKFNSQSPNSSMSTKEFDKLKIKESKAKDDMEKNDNQYKSLIEEVQRAKQSWEYEMETMCETFQTLDEKRIDTVRDLLWKSTNVDSQASVDHDECCERVRATLERCDIDKDINEFVNHYKVGRNRPPPVMYVPFGKLGNGRQNSIPHLPPPPSRPPPNPSGDSFNPYAEVSEIRENSIQDQYVAVKNHRPKHRCEIAMNIGDCLSVLGQMDSNGMVKVYNQRSKETGLVPLGNMELKDSSAFSF